MVSLLHRATINKILIKNLCESKGYGARRLIRQFPNKNWKRRGWESCEKLFRWSSHGKWQTRHIAHMLLSQGSV